MLIWDPQREIVPFNIPFLNRPIYWYGFFFSVGILFAYLMLRKAYLLFTKDKNLLLLDKLTFWMAFGIILGARLFDVIFYQGLFSFLSKPWRIFYVWEGGLASHGGVLGAIVAIFFYFYLKKKEKDLPLFLDLITAPAAIAGGFIRIGNFFNQEILGKPSSLPWSVGFGHPFDGSTPLIARHPVQLYESFYYFMIGALFWRLIKRKSKKVGTGKLFGYFLILIFGFRFFMEFLKEEQSLVLQGNLLTMGQYLSLPFIGLGLWFIVAKKK